MGACVYMEVDEELGNQITVPFSEYVTARCAGCDFGKDVENAFNAT